MRSRLDQRVQVPPRKAPHRRNCPGIGDLLRRLRLCQHLEFGTLAVELIERKNWQTKTEARLALFTYIEGWYNPRRRHSALAYLSPMNYEAKETARRRLAEEHGLTTVGACVACATPPVDNPATEHAESAEDLSL